jgi:ABC-type multidrug transport system fused ATPase/permease subunit
MINLLFIPVYPCPDSSGGIPDDFGTCEEYWNDVAWFWTIVLIGCLLGYVFLFYGFGTASERLNKRVRDFSFAALMRQEVAYFDQRSVGRITSQLQDDAARIHAFSSEPVRSALIALAAVITGVVLSFIVSNAISSPVISRFATTRFSLLFIPVYVAVCAVSNRLYPDHGSCNFNGNETNAWRGSLIR